MLLNKDGQLAWPGLAKHSQQTSPPITDHRRSSSVDRRRWHLVNSKIMIEQNVPSQQEGNEGEGVQFYWQCSGLYAIISRSLAIVTNRQRQRIDSSPVGSHISEASFETSLGAIKRRTHFLRSPRSRTHSVVALALSDRSWRSMINVISRSHLSATVIRPNITQEMLLEASTSTKWIINLQRQRIV